MKRTAPVFKPGLKEALLYSSSTAEIPQELIMRLYGKFRNNERELSYGEKLKTTSGAPTTLRIVFHARYSPQFQGHEILTTVLDMLQSLLLFRVGQTVSKFKVRKIFFLSSV